nr:MAG TPA: hypothetical protein [Caudoviricetes sp.]
MCWWVGCRFNSRRLHRGESPGHCWPGDSFVFAACGTIS